LHKVFARTLLSLALAVVIALAFWWAEGIRAALIFLALTLTLLMVHHAWMMGQLARWIAEPSRAKIPSALGAWSELFESLWALVERTRASQAALSDALVRFRQAGEALPDGVITLTDQLKVEWINPAAAGHFAVNAETMRGQSLEALFPEGHWIERLRTQALGVPLRVELQQQGLPRILQLRRIAFGRDQQLIFSEDMTRVEQVETMRRDFVANVSHELRTPLTVLRGFAETLQDNASDDPALRTRALARMVEQAGRMQRLVEDLLMLSRLEDPHYKLAQESVDVPTLAASIVADAESLSAGRHQVTAAIDRLNVVGNPDEIRSAFTNLVTNAVRYTPPGGRIHVQWVREGDEVWWRVRDSGEGIAPEHLLRLTERFYRVDKGRSRTNLIGGGGTGLGLSIVKHVMLRHGGRLDIKSQVGVGSEFSCVLPMARCRAIKAPGATQDG
jgi:two-component system, OmpR family, phosphate regulon sensor histidine kinase PhoR